MVRNRARVVVRAKVQKNRSKSDGNKNSLWWLTLHECLLSIIYTHMHANMSQWPRCWDYKTKCTFPHSSQSMSGWFSVPNSSSWATVTCPWHGHDDNVERCRLYKNKLFFLSFSRDGPLPPPLSISNFMHTWREGRLCGHINFVVYREGTQHVCSHGCCNRKKESYCRISKS